MINLLPIQVKKQVRAARANILLLRYTILLGAAIIFLTLISASVYIVLGSIKKNAEDTAIANKSKITNYSSIEAEAGLFRSNLATAKSILDKEVIYTNAILNIAQAIPEGVTINDLDLSPETFGSPIVISANAKSYEAAIGLKDSLGTSGMFSDVHFTSISGASDSDTGDAEAYPFSVTLGAIISKEAATR